MRIRFYSDIDNWIVEDMSFIPFKGMEIKYDDIHYIVENIIWNCDPYRNEILVYLDCK